MRPRAGVRHSPARLSLPFRQTASSVLQAPQLNALQNNFLTNHTLASLLLKATMLARKPIVSSDSMRSLGDRTSQRFSPASDREPSLQGQSNTISKPL